MAKPLRWAHDPELPTRHPNLCAMCVHRKLIVTAVLDLYRCVRPDAISYDPVTGQELNVSCAEERQSGRIPDQWLWLGRRRCGPKGIYFKRDPQA